MKTLSFKIEEELHQGLKIGAALEGRSISDILKGLIQQWVKGRDPFLHQLKIMPVVTDEEELSPEELAAIEDARAEDSAEPREELSGRCRKSCRATPEVSHATESGVQATIQKGSQGLPGNDQADINEGITRFLLKTGKFDVLRLKDDLWRLKLGVWRVFFTFNGDVIVFLTVKRRTSKTY